MTHSPVRSAAFLAMLLVAGCSTHSMPMLGNGQPGLEVAEAALQGNTPQIALQVADNVLSRNPRDAKALAIKGDALTTLGRMEEAGAAYSQALQIDRGSTRAKIGLGRLQLASNPQAAEKLFLEVLQVDPRNVTALNDLGVARDLEGQHEGAQAAYRQALGINPDLHSAQVNLALSMAMTGHGSDAIKLIKPLAINPGATRKLRHDYAAVLTMAGDRPEAERVLSQDLPPSEVKQALDAYARADAHPAMDDGSAMKPVALAPAGEAGMRAAPSAVQGPTFHQEAAGGASTETYRPEATGQAVTGGPAQNAPPAISTAAGPISVAQGAAAAPPANHASAPSVVTQAIPDRTAASATASGAARAAAPITGSSTATEPVRFEPAATAVRAAPPAIVARSVSVPTVVTPAPPDTQSHADAGTAAARAVAPAPQNPASRDNAGVQAPAVLPASAGTSARAVPAAAPVQTVATSQQVALPPEAKSGQTKAALEPEPVSNPAQLASSQPSAMPARTDASTQSGPASSPAPVAASSQPASPQPHAKFAQADASPQPKPSSRPVQIASPAQPASLQPAAPPMQADASVQASPAGAPAPITAPSQPAPPRQAAKPAQADASVQPKQPASRPVQIASSAQPVPAAGHLAPTPATEASADASAQTVPAGPQVQLVASPSEAAARALWDRLAERYPGIMGAHTPLVIRVDHNGQTFWRLRTAGFASAAEAHAFCGQLQANGTACIVAGS